MTRFLASLAISLVLLCSAAPARAQVHWDASAQVGMMKRFLASKLPGSGDAGFGPVGELHGHVALLPFLRVGPYLAHDIAPMPAGESALQITSFGGRVKVTSPIPLDPWRVWAFAGFGYAGVYGPSYHSTVAVSPTVSQDALATGAGGGFFEIPIGVGGSYKIWRFWHLTAELGARLGFGFTGSVFDLSEGRAAFSAGQPQLFLPNPGQPSVSVGLTVGIMLDL